MRLALPFRRADAMDQRGLVSSGFTTTIGVHRRTTRHTSKALVIPGGTDFEPPEDFVLIETDEDQTTTVRRRFSRRRHA